MTPEQRDQRAANIIALNLLCHTTITEDAAQAVAADSITMLRNTAEWGPRPQTIANTSPVQVCVWNHCTDLADGWRWDLRSRSYQAACPGHLADRPPLRLAGPDDAA